MRVLDGVMAEAPAPEIIDPPQYSIAWAILAVLCVVVIVTVVMTIARLTRRAVTRRAYAQGPTLQDGLKAEFLRAINELDQKVDVGELDERMAHQELTRVMRHFVRRSMNVDVRADTVTTLTAHPDTREIGELIGDLYEPDFAPVSTVPFAQSARRAREVIRRWS